MLNLRKTLVFTSLLRRPISQSFATQIPNKPSSHQYDDLINAAGRSGDFAAVRQLLNKRWRDGIFNTKYTFNFISSDLSALDDLLQTLPNLERGFGKKSAYDSVIARLSKLERTGEALRVVELMVKGNVGPNVITFYPMISYLTRKKKMEEGWRVVEVMREMKVSPDVSVYNYFLTSYCVEGELKKAAEVMNEMEKKGINADSRTYDALVLGLCKANNVEGAIMVLRRMVDDKLHTLYSTYGHVIWALLKMGYYAQAMEFVLCYAGRDKKLDSESFGILASRLIDLKKFDYSNLVLEEMSKRGLRMDKKLKDFCESKTSNDASGFQLPHVWLKE